MRPSSIIFSKVRQPPPIREGDEESWARFNNEPRAQPDKRMPNLPTHRFVDKVLFWEFPTDAASVPHTITASQDQTYSAWDILSPPSLKVMESSRTHQGHILQKATQARADVFE